jgi:endonuclease III
MPLKKIKNKLSESDIKKISEKLLNLIGAGLGPLTIAKTLNKNSNTKLAEVIDSTIHRILKKLEITNTI